jgi:hypothetical protein
MRKNRKDYSILIRGICSVAGLQIQECMLELNFIRTLIRKTFDEDIVNGLILEVCHPYSFDLSTDLSTDLSPDHAYPSPPSPPPSPLIARVWLQLLKAVTNIDYTFRRKRGRQCGVEVEKLLVK